MIKKYNESIKQKHTYGTSKGLICNKEKTRCNNTTACELNMINFVTKENKKLAENKIQIGHKFLIIDTEYIQLEALDLEKQIHYSINKSPTKY